MCYQMNETNQKNNQQIGCFSLENIANPSMFETTQQPWSNILKHTKTNFYHHDNYVSFRMLSK